MSRISVDKFIGGLYSIYAQKPVYKVGHDGSDGSCDGIGFIRGGLLRGGATKIANMKEVNQFARKTAVNIHKNNLDVKLGDVLLKVKDVDDSSMPLPSKYRTDGSELINYVDISIVVKKNPVEIWYMTKDGIEKSNIISEWDYICSLPYLEEEKKVMSSAVIFTESGESVKLYAKPSFACEDAISVANGTNVIITDVNDRWTTVSYGDKTMYVLSKFVKAVEEKNINGVDIKEIEKAYMILGKVLGYIK